MTVGIWLWVITEYLQSWKALERNRKWWLTSPVCVQNTYFVQSSVRGQVSHHTTLVKTQLFSLSSCSWRCFWWCCCSLTWTKTRHIPVVNAFKNSSQRGKTKQNTTPHTPHTAAFSTDYLYQQPRVWGEWLPKAVEFVAVHWGRFSHCPLNYVAQTAVVGRILFQLDATSDSAW